MLWSPQLGTFLPGLVTFLLGSSRGGSGVRDHRSGTSLRSKRLRGLKSDRWSDVEIAVLLKYLFLQYLDGGWIVD